MKDSFHPFFSVIVPVYNVKKYLAEAVDSVIRQEFTDYEIILVDDGSTDGSGELCDELSAKHEAVRVLHQANAGLSEARNSGMKAAGGRYVVLLDSDDMLSEHALSHLHSAIVKYHNPDFVVSRRETFVDGNNTFTPCSYRFDEELFATMDADDVYRKLQTFPDCWLEGCMFSVSHEYLEKEHLYFYPGIFHEDEEWGPRVFLNAKSIGYNNELLYRNRTERKGSITATQNIKRLFDRLRIADLLCEEAKKAHYTEKNRQTFWQRICKLVFGVWCDAWQYRKDAQYDAIVKSLSEAVGVLKKSDKGVHKAAYYCSRMIGVKNSGRILDFVKGRRKKRR